jgi:hypothetical protein
LHSILQWLEGSGLGHAIRAAGVWAYGVINLLHILGVASLFGAILVLDLRLLGLWKKLPVSIIAGPTVPVAACGFGVAAISGACMITTNATQYAGNPFLLIKFAAIALGLANVLLLHRLAAWRERGRRELTRHERSQFAVFGGTSLLSWLTAISAGRMIGYW